MIPIAAPSADGSHTGGSANGVLAGVLLAASSLTFSLAVLETVFHLFWPQPLYAVQNAPWGFSHIPNVSFTHGHEASYEHRWLAGREFVTRISYNSHGYRDYERAFGKPPGTARIVMIGDSMGEGIEVQL